MPLGARKPPLSECRWKMRMKQTEQRLSGQEERTQTRGEEAATPRGQEWSWVINVTEMWSHVTEGVCEVWLHKKVLGDSGE